MKELSSQRLRDGEPTMCSLHDVIGDRCEQSDVFILRSGLTDREPGVHEGRNTCKGLGQWAPSSGALMDLRQPPSSSYSLFTSSNSLKPSESGPERFLFV